MHGAGIAILCLIQVNRATVAVELTDFNGVLLAEPHAGMNRGHVFRKMFWEAARDYIMKLVIFFSAQEAQTSSWLLTHGNKLAPG